MEDFLSCVYRGLYSLKKPQPLDIALLRRAQPFRLDRDASALVSHLFYEDTPRDMVRRLELARLPHEVVWIEWDSLAVYDAAPPEVRERMPREKVAPMKGAVLRRIRPDDATVWEARVYDDADDPMGLAFECPMGFAVSTEVPVSDIHGLRVLAGRKQELDGRVLWATGPNEFPDKLIHSAAMTERDNKFTRLWARPNGKEEYGYFMTAALESINGLARMLCAALAVINEVPIRRHEYTPDGSFMGTGRRRQFLTNTTVSIDLRGRDLPKRVKGLLRNAHSRHRAHMVRGHWRHYHKGTPHEERVWIDAHARGDVSLGWVDHKYEVMNSDHAR